MDMQTIGVISQERFKIEDKLRTIECY